MNQQGTTTIKLMKLVQGGMSITVRVQTDPNVPWELPRLLARIGEMVGWTGADPALATAIATASFSETEQPARVNQ